MNTIFIIVLYGDTNVVSKSKYRVVYTIENSICDFPDIPENNKKNIKTFTLYTPLVLEINVACRSS